jgi:hypothetical protein
MTGRPQRDRAALARAFVAKAVLNLPTTEALIDRLQQDRSLKRLCGFDLFRKLPDAAPSRAPSPSSPNSSYRSGYMPPSSRRICPTNSSAI